MTRKSIYVSNAGLERRLTMVDELTFMQNNLSMSIRGLTLLIVIVTLLVPGYTCLWEEAHIYPLPAHGARARCGAWSLMFSYSLDQGRGPLPAGRPQVT